MIEWFSAVTTARVSATTRQTVAASKGLRTGTLTTATETPCLPSARAAASVGASIMPLATSATSVPD